MAKTEIVPFEIPTGLVLNPEHSYFAIAVPERSINLVYDPECAAYARGVSSGYSADGGSSIAAYAGDQRRGTHSIRVTNISGGNKGVYYQAPAAIAASQPYTFSFDHKGTGLYKAFFKTTGGVQVGPELIFEGKNFWTRHSITIFHGSSITPRLTVHAIGGGAEEEGFLVDGFQLENLPYDTTFISGDLLGYGYLEENTPYLWLGTPHRSASVRMETTKSGGRLRWFHEFEFHVMAYQGLGAVGVEVSSEEYAVIDGSYIKGVRASQRDISITGIIPASGMGDLAGKRKELVNLVRLGSSRKQPIQMVFQLHEGTEPISERYILECFYEEGAGASIDSVYGERVSISFMMPDPYIREDGESGVEISLSTDISAGDQIVGRNNYGQWVGLGAGSPETCEQMIIGPDNNLYVIDSDSGYAIKRYNGYAWETVISSGTYPSLVGIAFGGDGKLYFATESIVRRRNLSSGSTETISNTVVTTSNGINGIAAAPNGDIILFGQFTNVASSAGSVACTNVAYLDVSADAWSAPPGLGTTSGYVNAVYPLANKAMIAGGYFANGADLETDIFSLAYIAPAWSAWERIDVPLSSTSSEAHGEVNAIARTMDGKFVIGGNFHQSYWWNTNKPSDPRRLFKAIAWFNLSEKILRPMGLGLEIDQMSGGGIVPLPPIVYDLAVTRQNEVYVVGMFEEAKNYRNGFEQSVYAPGVVIWSFGYGWKEPEIIPAPVSDWYGEDWYEVKSIVYSGNLAEERAGAFGIGNQGSTSPFTPGTELGVPPGYRDTVYIGRRIGSGADVPSFSLVEIDDCEEAGVKLELIGPAHVYRVQNFLTGASVEFTNGLWVGANNALVIDTRPNRSLVYTRSGNILGQVSPSSNVGDFRLKRGKNSILVTAKNTTVATKVYLTYKKKIASIGEVL